MLPAWGFQSSSPWTIRTGSDGFTEISARSEITFPKDAGFAILKLTKGIGRPAGMAAILLIESLKRLPLFPFEKYDWFNDKTQAEFMKFEIKPAGQGKPKTMTINVPNGEDQSPPPGAYEFLASTSNGERVFKFLSAVRDGQELTVFVNGPPSSIQVSFDATGLKELLDQVMNGTHSGSKDAAKGRAK